MWSLFFSTERFLCILWIQLLGQCLLHKYLLVACLLAFFTVPFNEQMFKNLMTYLIFPLCVFATFCILAKKSLPNPRSQRLFLNIYLFIWLRWVLVAAHGLLSCGMHVGSSSLTRNGTRAPCTGSAESQPLRHQGSPKIFLLCFFQMF